MMGLLIKRSNPEISLLLSAAAVTMIGIAAISFAGEIKGLVKTVKTLCGTSDVFLAPVLKCTAVAIITKTHRGAVPRRVAGGVRGGGGACRDGVRHVSGHAAHNEHAEDDGGMV